MIVTGLSMIATPGIAVLARKLGDIIDHKSNRPPQTVLVDIPEMQGHVIIAGLGRVGRALTLVMDAEGIAYLAIENDMRIVAEKRKLGRPVSYGDASRYDMLKQFHPETAQAIVITMEDAHAAAETIINVRRHWPDLPVLVRARDKRVARILHKAGAAIVVAETMETSLQLSGNLLRTLGIEEDVISRRLDFERESAMRGIQGE